MGQAEIDEGKTYYAEKLATGEYHEAPEGYLYRFITAGQTGKGESNNSSDKPGPTSKVLVHYEGKLINGKVFDSSYARGEPISFGLNQVIKGWGLACQLMSDGDVIECILPEGLAYGSRGAGADIPGGATLIFKIELLPPPPPPKAFVEGKEIFATKKASGEYQEHKGMLYKWLSEAPAADAAKPTIKDQVTVHYKGTLLVDGTQFDSSYDRGQTIQFPLTNVIKGWTEILQIMANDSKLEVIIPAEKAYGLEKDRPKIPAGSFLVFIIELFSFEAAPAPQCLIM